MSAAGVFEDLSGADRGLGRSLIHQAGQLGVDGFADRHQQTVADYFARAGKRVEPEECWQVAADLWGFLRRGE